MSSDYKPSGNVIYTAERTRALLARRRRPVVEAPPVPASAPQAA
ncbi:hypothetical protein [Motilibacter aurantiacus]|nr:hypothetical protein [Motilibacter aurantiacus]